MDGSATDSVPPRAKPLGVANAVPTRKKNAALLRIATCYAQTPTGYREFLFMGPLLLLGLCIAYISPHLISLEKCTGGLTPNTVPMSEYHLDPVYNEKGELTAYRRILNKRPDGSSGV
ncbi:hypothetical protein ERJ75_000947200 [Trypanosoma vivax]|uniref:Uncharacterized protein n=1 Tax=Trypanosoma vivax (strain Y486) TaxID=1055687 RepID=G0U4H6_TRYVY|nr:hypothetical protein TRVL_01799 [Trypanosoma vivax]KAH8611950.1 hypothetical protein ERJ75_000947200 [Trypanosoma vivax]CCC52340.1 conserved hypothetical protein [Trypanosoma vivax Y486]